MKIYLFSTLVFIVVIVDSCIKKQEREINTVQVTALIDVTNMMTILPDSETLLSFYEFPKDKNKEAFFRLTTTTDKLLNPVSEYHLASGDETEKDNQFDDPDYREKQVLSFYSDVRQAVDAFNTKAQQDSEIGHSEVFRCVAAELIRMKENKADKNLLAIYSDLGENSDLFSVYNKHDQELLLQQPDSLIQKFEGAKLLPPDLYGFTVMIVFQPKIRQEDRMFAAMAEVYKKILKAHNAKVIICSDNPKSI